ncbi:KilA-N domain-containing protein [Prevotella melaninogenica]|uniref:KilA-N domain-containing protein n=1 Tax=Prevotella melaninogenica TaxID=28132 RepID=UPI001BAAD22C|nr:KilA-N domain-containing protein [Prevotella melaninogenica]QUB66098.1 KilA-N domain-containing protein [Prevotella melaninogenica]
MKINQVMTRPMGQFTVEQRTKDGFFDGANLLRQWNGVEGNPRRRMSEFLESAKVKEFLNALAEDESHRRKIDIAKNQLLTKVSGKLTKYGKTQDKVWMNPILFLKFAMWINPRFEVQVIRFVYDNMIEYRNEAGDAYKELCVAISKIVGKGFLRVAISNIAKAINWIVFNNHEAMIRNKEGIECKMKELFSAEKTIAMLINDGFLCSYDCVIDYLRRKWSEKWTPSELTRKPVV